jgi:hypothetical protein
VNLPFENSLTPADLASKGLHVLRVECSKCGRSGRYRVTTLAKQIGPHGKLTDWLYGLTKDCPRKNSPGLARMSLNHPDAIWNHFKADRRAQETLTAPIGCTHQPSRHFAIFRDVDHARVAKGLKEAVDRFGLDFVQMSRYALRRLFPHVQDLEQLLAYQVAKPRGRPPVTLRPPSPSAVLAQARKELSLATR